MSQIDAATEHFIQTKVTAIADWGNYLTGSDKVAAEQLTKGISAPDRTAKEREEEMAEIKNVAAQKHLPNFELINARDTDGNGVPDQFDGIKVNGRVLFERPHQQQGGKHTEKELVKMITPFMANDSQAGSEKLAKAVSDAVRDNELNEPQLRSLLYRLEDSRAAHHYPSKISLIDVNGDPMSVDGDTLAITRPKTSDFFKIHR